METYVVDAHSLIWFIADDERLSPKARKILELAEDGEVHDLIIGATTHYYRSKLITKDSVLHNSLEIEVVW